MSAVQLGAQQLLRHHSEEESDRPYTESKTEQGKQLRVGMIGLMTSYESDEPVRDARGQLAVESPEERQARLQGMSANQCERRITEDINYVFFHSIPEYIRMRRQQCQVDQLCECRLAPHHALHVTSWNTWLSRNDIGSTYIEGGRENKLRI